MVLHIAFTGTTYIFPGATNFSHVLHIFKVLHIAFSGTTYIYSSATYFSHVLHIFQVLHITFFRYYISFIRYYVSFKKQRPNNVKYISRENMKALISQTVMA
jgi:hypothetical protein